MVHLKIWGQNVFLTQNLETKSGFFQKWNFTLGMATGHSVWFQWSNKMPAWRVSEERDLKYSNGEFNVNDTISDLCSDWQGKWASLRVAFRMDRKRLIEAVWSFEAGFGSRMMLNLGAEDVWGPWCLVNCSQYPFPVKKCSRIVYQT